jgi:hypothetical protein
VRRRIQRQAYNWASWMIFGSRDLGFVNGLSVRSKLCAQKMSVSGVELGFLDDFWVRGS